MQSILCCLYRGGLRTFSCLLLLLGWMDKQQPPAPREAEPALNPLQSRKEHYGLCVRVLASHTALPLWFYGVKHTALMTAAQLHFSWRAHSHRTSFTRSLEWKRKGARSGPLEVLLSWAARVPEKHIYLFITPWARIWGAWLAVFAQGVWRGCVSAFDDRKGVFAVCTPAGVWGKERWVQGLLYDVRACAGKRWKAELHGRKEVDEDNTWRGRLFQSRIQGAPIPVPVTLVLFQPVPPHAAFSCKQDFSCSTGQDWVLTGLWQCPFSHITHLSVFRNWCSPCPVGAPWNIGCKCYLSANIICCQRILYWEIRLRVIISVKLFYYYPILWAWIGH